MRLLPILFASIVVCSAADSEAQTYHSCYEPDPPNCIDRYGTFDDEWSFDRCRGEVEDYVDDVGYFQSCLADWHQAIGYEAEDVIDRFNCKARGEIFCP
ncbi:hypothetical protein PSM7751_04254 [Pseudooceanicola marinus]|uniref:Uncharacterized protein n=1 Tax=Pseudooceanicola marinus TaxID=396013 RepID=A0A1X7ABR3_9RHOB|nr:hypothetical protein [Pseudooceanicola marinus]PJE33761.1 hypothetical protein CVM50_00065 [Pseudooceanicola marinus]SLN75112.1 hypothetical protein PSM7751_04254 [Pseudooceanicola marinus]